MAKHENPSSFQRYLHCEADQLLIKLVGVADRRTGIGQGAGYNVQADVETFSALTGSGQRRTGEYKSYNGHYDKEAAIRTYVAMTFGLSGRLVSKSEYERLRAAYEAELRVT